MTEEIDSQLSEKCTKGSTARFVKIIKTHLSRDKSQCLAGSFIPFTNRNCINIKNIDNKCILYCILYSIHQDALKIHPERPTKYKKYLEDLENDDKFKNLNLNFPFIINEENVKKLEDYFNITMNFYHFDSEENNTTEQIQLIYKSNSIGSLVNGFLRKHINILYIEENITKENYKSHFVLIKNLSGFLSGKIHHQNEHLNICNKCFKKCKTMNDLEEHIKICYTLKDDNDIIQNIELPKEGENILKYKSNGAELFHPYTLYADFECTLKKINKRKSDNCETILLHEYTSIPNSYGIYNTYSKQFISKNDSNKKRLLKSFFDDLLEYTKEYNKVRKINNIIIQDKESILKFDNTKNCEICNISFSKDIIKCWDHDHTTGKYRMALCNKCNINLKIPKFLPIVIHNLKGYDSKLFVKYLDEIYPETETTVLATSTEKFKQIKKSVVVDENNYLKCKNGKCKYEYNLITRDICRNCNSTDLELYTVYEKIELRFIDSMEFVSTSLDKAVKNLLDVNNVYCVECKKIRNIDYMYYKVSKNLDVNNESKILAYSKCSVCNCKNKKLINFNHLENFNNVFKDLSLKDKCYLLRKGVYPYEFIDDYKKLSITEFPNHEDFNSKLNGNINDKDYRFAKKFWKHFNCKTFKDYHNWYLKLDVILLSDVFDNFRKECFKNYNLDPIHYISSPHLSNSAALKLTKQKLELLTDQDKYEFYENGTRGGISQISHNYEYAKANNCYY